LINLALYSRDLIRIGNRLTIIVDIDSLLDALVRTDEDIFRLMDYRDVSEFRIVCLPSCKVSIAKREVPNLIIRRNVTGDVSGFDIPWADPEDVHEQQFEKSLDLPNSCYWHIHTIHELYGFEKVQHKFVYYLRQGEALLALYVLSKECEPSILVTENKSLLKKRDLIQHRYFHNDANIVNVAEAIEIMNLYLKWRKKYHFSGCNSVTEPWYWYLIAFRSKVQHYHGGDDNLEALANRFVFVFMSLEEVGFHYYSATISHQTGMSKLYHFNYFTILCTGILDNLALFTKKCNSSYFRNMDDAKASLDSTANYATKFLKALEICNPNLRSFINKHSNFIRILFDLRHKATHREMSSLMMLDYDDKERRFKASLVRLEEDEYRQIKCCELKKEKYSIFSELGTLCIDNVYWLEPYLFMKGVTERLLSFTDEYLHISGLTNSISELTDNSTEPAYSVNKFLRYGLF
jgi:hypothetical protein